MFNIMLKTVRFESFLVLEASPEYDEEFHSIESLIMDICEYLSGFEEITFEVVGFGLEWPVDVQTDLATIITQIPPLLMNIKNRKEAKLQFYEQGIERELVFKDNGGATLAIACFDLFNQPLATCQEHISFLELIDMLSRLLQVFLKLSEELCPKIVAHKLFQEWLKGFRSQIE